MEKVKLELIKDNIKYITFEKESSESFLVEQLPGLSMMYITPLPNGPREYRLPSKNTYRFLFALFPSLAKTSVEKFKENEYDSRQEYLNDIERFLFESLDGLVNRSGIKVKIKKENIHLSEQVSFFGKSEQHSRFDMGICFGSLKKTKNEYSNKLIVLNAEYLDPMDSLIKFNDIQPYVNVIQKQIVDRIIRSQLDLIMNEYMNTIRVLTIQDIESSVSDSKENKREHSKSF